MIAADCGHAGRNGDRRMDFALTEDQQAIRDAVAAVCSPFDDAYRLDLEPGGGNGGVAASGAGGR